MMRMIVGKKQKKKGNYLSNQLVMWSPQQQRGVKRRLMCFEQK